MKPVIRRGYAAYIECGDEDGCFAGRVAGVQDIIVFHGGLADEIRHAFADGQIFALTAAPNPGVSRKSRFPAA